MHSEVVAFSLPWADFEIDREDLTITATPQSETPEQVRDLALGVIEILAHTPIEDVGLTTFAHYQLDSQGTRDDLGWTLVPPDPFSKQLVRPGMRTLKMAGRRPEQSAEEAQGGIVVTIEPSAHFSPNGVFISVLDQYDVSAADPGTGTGPAIECVKSNWSQSLQRADVIAEEIFGLV